MNTPQLFHSRPWDVTDALRQIVQNFFNQSETSTRQIQRTTASALSPSPGPSLRSWTRRKVPKRP